jgi:ketosteroid isomerase-like protein
MGQARELLDRVTDAVTAKDPDALMALYAPDAVAETPDEGTLSGRDAIVGYMTALRSAFPDASFEIVAQHETADTAIDEGYFLGTNTGDIGVSGGETIPATGRSVRVRECDVATVSGGLIASHRFYFDQMELLAQLGLLGEE